MSYQDLLKSYIKNSDLTLDEISEKLSHKGLSATKQYLSRLQNGKNPPASDELNKAIAEITGGDPHKLIWQALVEKAPKEIQNNIYYIADGDNNVRYIGEANNESARWLAEHFGGHKVKEPGQELTQAYLDLQKVDKVLRVPVLGHIAAGLPILAQEHIESYEELVNPGHYKDGELFILRVKGDSMEGSRIYDGDNVVVKIQPEVENGEIAVVNVNGHEATLKKVKKLDNGQVWLFPSNDKYDPILLDNERARIVGKVIQVIFEP